MSRRQYRNVIKITCCLVFVGFLFDGVVSAAEPTRPLTFYRDSQGVINQQSRQNSITMRRIANAKGHVSLWITLNYPFNASFDEMTEEERAAQEQDVAVGFSEMLDAMVARGDAWHPTAGPVIIGPGCAVRVSKKGLNNLLKDDRVLQITAIETLSGE